LETIMPSRREFIQTGLAVSIAPVALPIPTIEGLAARVDVRLPAHRPLYCVVLDVRYPWAGDLAREARRLGIKAVRTSGDITDFWYRDLSLRWRDTPVAIAGVTANGPLFCLERFGWDHGLRVVFRDTSVESAPDGETLLTWVIAPKPQVSATPADAPRS
jgi:hypothetical protein